MKPGDWVCPKIGPLGVRFRISHVVNVQGTESVVLDACDDPETPVPQGWILTALLVPAPEGKADA